MPQAANNRTSRSRSRPVRVRPTRVRFAYIQQRDGRYLTDASGLVLTWAEHGPRLAFRTRQAAEAFIGKKFAGRAGVELLGVWVVEE